MVRMILLLKSYLATLPHHHFSLETTLAGGLHLHKLCTKQSWTRSHSNLQIFGRGRFPFSTTGSLPVSENPWKRKLYMMLGMEKKHDQDSKNTLLLKVRTCTVLMYKHVLKWVNELNCKCSYTVSVHTSRKNLKTWTLAQAREMTRWLEQTLEFVWTHIFKANRELNLGDH